jgi:hypothetical protein
MAEDITVEGQPYRKRSPWGVWGLSLITLGIYGLVWYYKINDEARRFLRDDLIRPGVSVLALFPGAFVIVPPFVSMYRTGQRIVRMEERVRIQKTVEPILGLVAYYVAGLSLPYYQGHLNVVWDSALASAARPMSTGGPSMPPPPPPPPAPMTQPPSALPPDVSPAE